MLFVFRFRFVVQSPEPPRGGVAAPLRARAKITWQNARSGESDQFSIPNSQFSSESGEFPVRQPLRMRIENWELSNWSDPPPDSVSGETAELFLSEPLVAQPPPPLGGSGLCTTERGRNTKSTIQSTRCTKKKSEGRLFVLFVAPMCFLCSVPVPLCKAPSS